MRSIGAAIVMTILATASACGVALADDAAARREFAPSGRLRVGIAVAPEDIRYRQRTTAERVNARLKDEFGGRFVRVRGHAKVTCHLMFGILALTVDQLMRLVPG